MFFTRTKLLLTMTVISESASVFAVCAFVGMISNLDSSPMSFTNIVGVLGGALLIGRFGPSNVRAVEIIYLIKAPFWIILAYVAVGSEVDSGLAGVDLLWISTVFFGTGQEGYLLSVVEAVVVVVFLLWRGIKLSTGTNALKNLQIGFRFGLIPIAIAAVVDIFHSGDLKVFQIAFVFFASGLAGISIGNLMTESESSLHSRAWLKVIAGIVLSLVLIGFLFTLVHKGLSAIVSNRLSNVFGFVGDVSSSVVSTIFSPVINFVYDLGPRIFKPSIDFQGLAEPFRGETILPTITPADPSYLLDKTVYIISDSAYRGMKGEETSVWYDVFFIFIQVILVALVIGIIVGILMLVHRLLTGSSFWKKSNRGESESMSPESIPLSDFVSLVPKLVPDWIKKRKKKSGPRLPDGPPGLVEPLRIYYRMIRLAENRGVVRDQHKTALEFQTDLWDIFPRSLVRMATEAFNRACYGSHSAEEQEIAQIKESINQTKRRESRI